VCGVLRFLFEQTGMNGRIRRSEFLRLAGLGALTGSWARADQPAGNDARIEGVPRAKSVIVVFASGGQSQIDMWDPKPDAPREIRGEFDSISTSVPGTFLCEHLPRLAVLADRYTLLRTMSHADLDHGSAVYLSLTGQYHSRITSNPAPARTDLPSWMGVYKRVRPATGTIDQAVEINGPAIVAPQDIAPGQFGGLLGRDFDPLFIGDPNADSAAVPGLVPQPQLPAIRVRRRERLLSAIDRYTLGEGTPLRMTDLQGQYARAFELLANPRTREAFDLSAEPEPVRTRYGRHRAGQSCLLARRLAEAGVPLITVVWNHHNRGQDLAPNDKEQHGWDTHNDIFDLLRGSLLPRFDQSFSALLEDLESRGMLETTLVICMGEFGRAPRVALERNFAGASPGRKHWSSAYSILLAGAGINRGAVMGRTDRHGAFPASESYGPWDIAATIFAALGVDPGGHYVDPFHRPFPISTGKPIRAAYRG
jgi:hypothetical protein